jgi:hypothetical protein
MSFGTFSTYQSFEHNSNTKILSIITSLSISSYTGIQIALAYEGNYNNVSITKNDSSIASHITGTSYISTGLYGNTSYTYIVTPYDITNFAGSSSTITQITLPTLTSLSLSSSTISQILLVYDGSFASVNITRGGSSIATGVTTLNYTDSSGLTVNTSYIYVVTPTNSGGYSIGGLKFSIYDGYYSNNASFTSSATLRTSGLLASSTGYNSNISSINAGTNSAIPSNGSLSTYTVEWVGYFLANVTGTWTFYTNSDDGSQLWIGSNATSGYTIGNSTVDNSGSHAIREKSGTAELVSGTYYPIRIIFGEDSGDDNMIVSFTPPSGTKTTVGTGYYFSGLTFPVPASANITGIPITVTKSTLPNITTAVSVSTVTASQIILAYAGNFNTVSITRGLIVIGTVITSTYTDNTVSANTSYTYIVTPYNVDGSGGTTSTITKVTLPNITTAVSVSTVTASQIILAYVGNFNTVSITRGVTVLGTVGTSTYTDNTVSANTSYTYIVTPYNVDGSGGTTSTITKLTLPNITTAVSVSSVTTSQIILAYAGNYSYVSITRGVTVLGTVGTSTYTDNTVSANTSYTYIVTPYNVDGSGGITSTITKVTLPNPPTAVSASVSSSTAILVTFTAPTGGSDGGTITYNVIGSPSGSASSTSTSITVSGLTSNTAYTFTVTASNSSGTSAASSPPSTSVTTLSDTPTATNGTISYVGSYSVYTFLSNGSITFPSSKSAQILVVGGGGAGGQNSSSPYTWGGGGGAGGASSLTISSLNGTYTVTVGSGGVASSGTGSSSSLVGLVTKNGGEGGVSATTTVQGSGGSGTSGGGSGGAGATDPGSSPTNGSSGTAYTIPSVGGTSTVYGGGGSGGNYLGGPGGGTGGSGGGASSNNSGTANTGGGGGGGNGTAGGYRSGGNGGSGIVKIAFLT